jgi:LCP family protein required for cell wall assembly
MTMIEDELRATFARHEELTPATGPLREAIDRTAVRRRRRRRTIGAAAAVIAVLATVSVPALARSVTRTPVQVDNLLTADASPVPDRPLNFLLLGLDRRSSGSAEIYVDTVMIMHVPRDRSRAYLVSIPRDLRVEIPGHGVAKLNQAFVVGSDGGSRTPDLGGGAALTARTLNTVTRLSFDGTVTVTYSGARRMTDAVGGVRICLDQEVRSVHTKRVFPAKCQQLDGAAAVDLLRQRYGMPDGAYDRDRNGQRFLRALLARLAGHDAMTNPMKLSALLRAGGEGLVIDTEALPLAQLLPILPRVAAADPIGIAWTFNRAPGPEPSYEQLDPELSGSLFDAMRRDGVPAWVAAHPRWITR